MSFTAEWTPTTGFNTSGYTVKFGKQLNQCVVDEIVAHPMCGSNHPLANCAYVAKDSDLGYSSVAMHLANAQFKEPIPNGQSNTWVCSPAPSGDNALVYRRTIFVGMPTNVAAPQYCLTDQCDNKILIIEDIKNPNKLVYNYGNINWGIGAAAPYRTMALQIRHTCNRGQSAWGSAPQTVTYTDTSDPDNPQTTIYKICIYHVYTIGTDCFIVGYDYIAAFGGRYQNASNQYNFLAGGSNYKSFVSANGNDLFIGLNINHTGAETNLQGILGEDIYPDPVPNPATFDGNYITYAPQNIVLQNARLRFSMTNSTIGGYLRSCGLNFDLVDTEEIRKQQFARAGIYFVVNGELFKPIISGGIVIGYGTPEQESEIDEYTDLNHPVPSGGGGGGGGSDDDDMDNQGLGATGSSGGFTQFFVMSPADMSSFLTDFYTNADAGETLSNNLVCSYILGSSVYYWGATESIKITVHNSAQGTPFETQGTYSHVTATNNNIPLGSFTIDRMTNTFYDFAPYSSYEIFIPCCGWVSLPDTVAGRTIYVSLQIDIATCGAKGVVKFDDGATCAVCTGVLGSSIPLAVIESGLLRGANVQAASNTLGGALMAGAGFGNGNVGLGLNGVSKVVDAFTQCAISGNTNFTNQKGSSGDITQFAMGHKCYVKITHPVVDKVVETTGFGHSVGYLCNVVGKLSTFKGFTICSNPHITGIVATDAEKEEIKQLLESGVIL